METFENYIEKIDEKTPVNEAIKLCNSQIDHLKSLINNDVVISWPQEQKTKFLRFYDKTVILKSSYVQKKKVLSFTDIEGRTVKVTDLKKAIENAEEAVKFHELRKNFRQQGIDVLYFKDAHKYWQDALNKLNKLS